MISLIVFLVIKRIASGHFDEARNKMTYSIVFPVKIDEAISLVSRDHFLCICMEIDLEKPLISKFQLRRKVRKIEYEGIHLVCFSCGRFNH